MKHFRILNTITLSVLFLKAFCVMAEENSPEVYWSFDGDNLDNITGYAKHVKGVRRSALKFDGFTTRVTSKADAAIDLTTGFTVEAWIAISLISATEASARPESRPNIVLILADDLGIECLSSYGGNHKTPNIDKLATQGMLFTHCFSNPYCSPSRANLLTGRYPFKNGLREVIWNERTHANTYLHTDQLSFARQLKQAGYTTAIAGKWQLSFLHRRNTIEDFGFDQYQCWQIFRTDKSKTRRFHTPYFNRNGTVIADEIKDRFGPDVNVEFLIDFIKANAAKERPFLAYYTSLLPHFPWVPTPDSED